MKFLFYSIFGSLLFLSCGQGNSLFQKIDAGIRFENTITPTDAMNAFNFTNFYNGGGVGIGDFNNDGLKDIVLTGNQVEVGVFLNTGELSFRDISAESGVENKGWVTGVSIIDINQDGWDDIYLSMASHVSLKSSENLLYINQKTETPTFKEEGALYGLNFSGFSMQTVFFDYDLDGDLDAYMLNTAPDSYNASFLRPAVNDGTFPSADKLFENQGLRPDGKAMKYVDVSIAAGITYEGLGLGVALSDFNNDGYPDIYCSNDFISNDILYLNNGDGTFSNIINDAVDHTSLFGMGVDAADLNNDNRVDILQLDMLPEDNARQKQMVARSDYQKKKLSTSSQYGYTLQYMRNSLQINEGIKNGKPVFSEMGLLEGIAQTDWSWSVLMADYDADGYKDVFISNGYRKNVTDLDFVSYKNQNRVGGAAETQEENREKILKAIPEIKLRNYAFRNDSLQGFTNVSALWGIDEASYANGAAYADLDNDGDLDLIVNNIDAPVSLYENTLQNASSVSVAFEGKGTGIGAKVIAWSNGKSQFFENFPCRGYLSTQAQEIVIGLGKANKLDSLRIIWPNRNSELKTNIVKGSRIIFEPKNAKYFSPSSSLQKQLFEEKSEILDFEHLETDFVDFNQTPALHKMQTRSGPVIAYGDLNGDETEDLVFGGSYRGSPTSIYLQSQAGFKNYFSFLDARLQVGDIVLFDADSDSDLDILLVPSASEMPFSAKNAYQPILYLNDGKANFEKAPNFPSFEINSIATIAFDYDQDGDKDLLLAGHHLPGKYPLGMSSVILENTNGVFEPVENSLSTSLNEIRLITDLLLTDYDHDGDQDLVLTAEWQAPFVIENNSGQFKLKAIPNAPTGWWNCIAQADLDNDGDMDYVLGNEGLNTIFRASEKEPITLLAKDFNGDGSIDPIMGYYLQGKEVPFLPLGTLTEQVVQFRQKYQLFADYGKANFSDLFAKDDLLNSQKLQVNELKSMVAINENGQLIFKELPRIAQSAPIQDILIKDFDQNGTLDMLITASFYPNESNMGQQDASHGLLLVGNGDGTFVQNNMHEAGFFVKGDVRSTIFLPKSKLLITTVNNGKAIAHRWLNGEN